MDAGVVENVFSAGDPKKAGALFKGFRSQLWNLFQGLSVGKRTVFFPVGHDVFSHRRIDA